MTEQQYTPIDGLESRVLLAADSGPPSLGAVPDSNGPDPTVRFRHSPKGTFVGGTASRASVVVSNIRAAPAGTLPTTVALYLSTDPALDAGDRAIATAPVRASLKFGRRSVVKFNPLVFPIDVASGTYHVLAHVDDVNATPKLTRPITPRMEAPSPTWRPASTSSH